MEDKQELNARVLKPADIRPVRGLFALIHLELFLADDLLRRKRIKYRSGIGTKHIKAAVSEPLPIGIAVRVLLDGLDDRVTVLHQIGIQFLVGDHHLACLLIDLMINAYDDEGIDDLLIPVAERSSEFDHLWNPRAEEPTDQVVQCLSTGVVV